MHCDKSHPTWSYLSFYLIIENQSTTVKLKTQTNKEWKENANWQKDTYKTT